MKLLVFNANYFPYKTTTAICLPLLLFRIIRAGRAYHCLNLDSCTYYYLLFEMCSLFCSKRVIEITIFIKFLSIISNNYNINTLNCFSLSYKYNLYFKMLCTATNVGFLCDSFTSNVLFLNLQKFISC